MIPVEFVFGLIDMLRGEAVQLAENPPEEYRSEFGSGRVAGMLQAIRRAETLIKEEQDARAQQLREEPRFEGDDVG